MLKSGYLTGWRSSDVRHKTVRSRPRSTGCGSVAALRCRALIDSVKSPFTEGEVRNLFQKLPFCLQQSYTAEHFLFSGSKIDQTGIAEFNFLTIFQTGNSHLKVESF